MITIEKRGKIDIISFTVDRINALITDDLRDEVTKVLENGSSKVIINLKNVKYIDSSGFGCLLILVKNARNNYCTIKFAETEPEVMEVMKTLFLDSVFDISSTLDECVRSMS